MGSIDDNSTQELARLQLAFEATGDGMWEWNLETGDAWFSQRAREMLGGATDKPLTAVRPDVRARIHPDDLALLQMQVERMVKGEASRCSAEIRVWHLGGRWVWVLVRGGVLARGPDGRALQLTGTLKDIGDRKAMEIENKVLLQLSDVLLREGDAGAMVDAALAILGAHFRPSRVCLADVDDTAGTFTIRHEWLDGTEDSLLGTYPLSRYEQGNDKRIRTGQTVCVPDILAHPRWTLPEIAATYTSHDIRAILSLPMIRNGVFEGILFFHQSKPRTWTEAEKALAENARTRIWDAVMREQAEARLRESQSRFASIFDLTPTIPWVVDPDGKPLMLGANYADMTGLQATEVADDGWAVTVHPDDRDEAVNTIVGCRASGEPIDLRYRMSKADGAYRWVRVHGAARRDGSGRILYWAGYIADIDHQVEAELALQASEAEARKSAAMLAQVIETTPDPIWVLDLDRRYAMVNSASERVLGKPRADIIGRHVSDLLPLEFQAAAEGQIEAIETGTDIHVEEWLYAHDYKAMRLFENRKVPLRDADGQVIGSMGIGRDITERKEVERALRASEADARASALLLDRVLETTPDPIWVVGADHRFIRINSASAGILGVGRGEAVGKLPEEVLPPALAAEVREQQRRNLAGEDMAIEERVFDAARAEPRLFDSRKALLRGPDGEIAGLVGIARDITDRKEVELRLQAIVDTAVDAIVVIDESGCILSANPATTTLFGHAEAEMLGRNVAMLMPPEDSGAHDRYIRNYRTTGTRRIIGVGRQVMGLRKDGSSFPLDLSLAEWFDGKDKRHFTGIMRDVTARLESEVRLRRAQDTVLSVSRLSAAGAMASTLAHELNQPLTASSNLLRSARRLLERGEDSGKVPGLLQEAASEVLRAGAIIRRMREYTVNGELEPARHQLQELAETALAMVQRRPEAKGVKISWELDPAVDEVLADRIQIEQVIVNLLRNAVEAMQGSAERRIEIETQADGTHAALRVHDSGHGIPEGQMERLFQPFATTKDRGTGLGLAICRTIVEAHGGQIHANNRPGGGGATFTITLPVPPRAQARSARTKA